MIPANELRIGNWVNYAGTSIVVDSIYTEDQFGNAGINVDTEEYSYNSITVIKFSDLYPIPLTPEIFSKCGLDEINIVYADEDPFDGNVFGDYKVLEYRSRMKNGFYLRHSTRLLYLHQLQNLYFSITGDELQIAQ